LTAAARIAEARGDATGAIRMLRDQTESDSRSVLLAVLARSQGAEAALAWLADQRFSVSDLTAHGVLALCRVQLSTRNFDAAKQVLSIVHEPLLVDCPYLLFLRGAVRVACLFPGPERDMALSGLPLDVRFAKPTILDESALATELDAARSDFERFLTAAQGLDLREAVRVAEAYLTWSDLLHPQRRHAALARLRTDMNEPARALWRVQFAFAYDPQFDPRPLTHYLDKREALVARRADSSPAFGRRCVGGPVDRKISRAVRGQDRSDRRPHHRNPCTRQIQRRCLGTGSARSQ
jgi:hypothetical protein